MQHSYLNQAEILKKGFIPKGFELGTTLSSPNRSITGFKSNESFFQKDSVHHNSGFGFAEWNVINFKNYVFELAERSTPKSFAR